MRHRLHLCLLSPADPAPQPELSSGVTSMAGIARPVSYRDIDPSQVLCRLVARLIEAIEHALADAAERRERMGR